jgi:hypothetical protein
MLASLLVLAAPAWAQDDDDDIFELSPFTVDASKNQGYRAENTLAGSRLNTRVSDLAASITVVTAEQMEDTASLDINDILRYEANTEGASTYTEGIQSLRNDGVVDTNAGFTHGADGITQDHNTANRIRGIGRPGTTVNYYQSLSGVPFDSYNTESVEINRGPNSMLFGMGNPAGIVNQSTANAQIGSDRTKIGFRLDDRGSFRASLSFNRTLIDNKLAIYGALLQDDRGFERKPSYDDTTRMYGAITYKPFEKTTFRGSIESYENDNRRANTLTPRDSVSEWRNGGMWGYDPSTGNLWSAATGQNKGPLALNRKSPIMDQTRAWIEAQPGFDASLWSDSDRRYNGVAIYGGSALTDPNSILYTPGLALGNNSRPKLRMYDGQVLDNLYFRADRYRLGFGSDTNPAANAPRAIEEADIFADATATGAYNTGFSSSALYSGRDNGIGSYQYPGVTDRSIYDWENVNTLHMNFGEKDNTTINLEFEQQVLKDLNFSLGYFEQDFDSMTNYTVSQLNVATFLVDTNTHLPDGSANQMFGLPMMMGPNDPDRFERTNETDTTRAMLAWTPDFTQNDGWTKWFGRHQAIGVASQFSDLGSFKRKRWYIFDSDEAVNEVNLFMRHPITQNWFENRSMARMWYLADPGDAQDGTVTRSAGAWNNATYEGDLQYFNWASNSWQTQRYNSGYVDSRHHTGRSQREVDSLSYGLTSYLWNDRLITTLGYREDDYQARATTTGAVLDQDGNAVEAGWSRGDMYGADGYLKTDVFFDRWNRWDSLSGNTSTVGAVLRPFDQWDGIENEFLSSLGFSYNKSDNFNPPSAAQVDAFGNELPKPEGVGEDLGVQFSLLDNKLFARVNWFKASNDNERTNPGTTLSRFTNNVDIGQFRNWARTISLINMGHNPVETATFGADLTTEDLASLDTATESIWGLPYNYYEDLPGQMYATRSAEAEGMELQLNYNPLPNWTIKLTAGKQETIYSNVLKEFYEWYDARTPAWFDASAADHLLPEYQGFASYTNDAGAEVDLTNFWSSYGYTSQVKVDNPLSNTIEGHYDEIVTPQVAIASDLEGQAAKGQRKYRWSILSNYKFEEGAMKGYSLGGSLRWEDAAVIGYYGRANPGIPGATDLTLADTTRPIYDSANTRVDLWLGYSRKLKGGKKLNLRFNIVDAFEDGGLQTVAVNYDGSSSAYRIIDPRQFIFSSSLEF